jgi:hypothetical protein
MSPTHSFHIPKSSGVACHAMIPASALMQSADAEVASAEFASADAEFASAEFASAEFASAEFASAEFASAEFAICPFTHRGIYDGWHAKMVGTLRWLAR